MTGSREHRPVASEQEAASRAKTSVDEMFRKRHKRRELADVESPSRAAGGFPTLGGGVRRRSRPDMAGLVVSAPLGAVGPGRRGGGV